MCIDTVTVGVKMNEQVKKEGWMDGLMGGERRERGGAAKKKHKSGDWTRNIEQQNNEYQYEISTVWHGVVTQKVSCAERQSE